MSSVIRNVSSRSTCRFCQWDVVFVGRTTMPFVTYKQLFCGCLYKTETRATCSVFCHSLMQIKTAGSGGVAKEQIKHRQKTRTKQKCPSLLSSVMGEKSRRKVPLEITHKFTHLPRKFSTRSPSSFIIMSNTARNLPACRIYIMLLCKYIYFLTQRTCKHL